MNVHSTSYPSPRHLSSRLTFYGVVTVPRATGAAAAAGPSPACCYCRYRYCSISLLSLRSLLSINTVYGHCYILPSTCDLLTTARDHLPSTHCDAAMPLPLHPARTATRQPNNRTSAAAAAARPAGRHREGQREGTDT